MLVASDGLAFRANAYREHTHLICRLPLDYLVLLARAFKAWGPDADIGTASRKGKDLNRFFHKREWLSLPRTSARLCRRTFCVTARRDLDRWFLRSKEKITLPGSIHTVTGIVWNASPLHIPTVCSRNVNPGKLSPN